MRKSNKKKNIQLEKSKEDYLKEIARLSDDNVRLYNKASDSISKNIFTISVSTIGLIFAFWNNIKELLIYGYLKALFILGLVFVLLSLIAYVFDQISEKRFFFKLEEEYKDAYERVRNAVCTHVVEEVVNDKIISKRRYNKVGEYFQTAQIVFLLPLIGYDNCNFDHIGIGIGFVPWV